MKKRHNKKRNIAFVYEALVREATVAVMRKDAGRRDKVVNILKKHFGQDSLLKRELDCYRSLYENQSLDETTSQKILVEARMHRRAIDPNGLFKQKTELIKDINQDLSPSVFNNFVPNYKSLATISQIFSTKTSPKTRVMMEQQVIAAMSRKPNTEDAPEIDNVIYQSFVKKFNDKYGGELLDEQKALLAHYISSFSDNALQLKMFLNEEIARLKSELEKAKSTSEIKADSEMLEKTGRVVERLNGFAKAEINEHLLLTVLNTQSLIKEINTDANHN